MSSAFPAFRPRLPVLDVLRGLAALWVALYHFTGNGRFHDGFPADGPLKWLGTHGWLGVYAFFVISGFIVPWTMEKAGYRLRDYGRFLWKRVLRLHPLYMLSVGAMLLPFAFGRGADMAAREWRDWWPHFFYLNGLLNRPWLMEIYWTLAIEAQYYLAIGLIFPLLAHRLAKVRWLTLGLLIAAPLIFTDHRTVLPFSALFVMGILIFQRMTHRLARGEFWLGLVLCGLVTTRAVGGPHALTAMVSAVIIFAVPLRHPGLIALGTVSYPFYLFHLVIGGMLMPLIMRCPRHGWLDTLLVLGLLVLSLAAAWLLHRWVELPFQKGSSAIRYRHR